MSSGRIVAITPTEFIPPDRTDNLFSAFIQDDVPLLSDRLTFTMGTKVEHNAYSGFEIQPSLRLSFAVDPLNTVVGSMKLHSGPPLGRNGTCGNAHSFQGVPSEQRH